MLTRLRIRNLAVVENAELEFGDGLNVLTGSTGAGKSLVLSAVNILLGERSSAQLVRQGCDSANVFAEFCVSAPDEVLAPHVSEGRIALRRVVRSSGRSRAFINDTPVTVRELQGVCARLIEPHGQNEQYRLRDPETHVGYLDAFAGNTAERAAYAAALEAYRAAVRERGEFERAIRLVREKAELLQHRIEELQRADLQAGERESLEREVAVMENAERIHSALNFSCEALYDDDASVTAVLSQVRKQLATVAGVAPELDAFAEQLDGAAIAIRESVDGMRAFMDRTEHDPAVLDARRERLDAIIAIERRYNATAEELIERRAEWEQELDGLAFEDERRAELTRLVGEAADRVSGAGAALSKTRREAGRRLDRAMGRELESLMMKGATFRADLSTVPDEGSDVRVGSKAVSALDDGVDVVRFMVRTNPGEAEGGVHEIASTGEVSRIALALKKLTNTGSTGSVLIFDEIDAGVGADLGRVIAEKLLALSETYQIVCITHMAQIAAAGRRHLVVSKRAEKDRTFVAVSTVSPEERRREIARMLGGEQGSDRRLALADELLANQPDRVRP